MLESLLPVRKCPRAIRACFRFTGSANWLKILSAPETARNITTARRCVSFPGGLYFVTAAILSGERVYGKYLENGISLTFLFPLSLSLIFPLEYVNSTCCSFADAKAIASGIFIQLRNALGYNVYDLIKTRV